MLQKTLSVAKDERRFEAIVQIMEPDNKNSSAAESCPAALHFKHAAPLLGRDACGNLASGPTGNESEAELREAALQFMDACPGDCEEAGCPFRILGHLYHGSSKALINSMTRDALLDLFAMEFEFRQKHPHLFRDPAARRKHLS